MKHALDNDQNTSKMDRLKQLCSYILGSMILMACPQKDPPLPPATNEEELITTLRLAFTSSGGTETKEFLFTDLDGDGGDPPVIVADTLSHDSTYSVTIELLNESLTPAEDITAEVVAEAEEHQFFFQISGVICSVTYADTDGNGKPIGLNTTWTLGAPSAGSVMITLRHQPDKSAAGVSSGDITNAGGETDLEVTFPVVIE